MGGITLNKLDWSDPDQMLEIRSTVYIVCSKAKTIQNKFNFGAHPLRMYLRQVLFEHFA